MADKIRQSGLGEMFIRKWRYCFFITRGLLTRATSGLPKRFSAVTIIWSSCRLKMLSLLSMKNKILTALFIVCFSLSLAFAAELSKLENIQKVISGDTFQLKSGKKVRLIGVDAPEIEANKKAKEEAERTGQDVDAIVRRGKEAQEWVKTRLEGKNIFLKYDKKKKDSDGTDLVYAYLYDVSTFYGGIVYAQLFEDLQFEWWQVPQRGKFLFINATLVRAGYGLPVADPPNVEYASLFERAYQEAKENYEGLWNADYFSAPCAKEGEKIGDCPGCVVKCCKGLEPMFALSVADECQEFPLPGSGGYCSNCGNNICESQHLEDNCNCPKDCD